MSKSNTFENDFLKLIFNNVAITLIGDAAGIQPSAVDGDLFLSLHSADPGEAGTQTTSEIAYTGYGRKGVPRDVTGFLVSGNAVQLASNEDFPAGTGGSGTATHFAIGCASSGTGKVLYKGPITPNIVCGNGVTPRLNAGTDIVTED